MKNIILFAGAARPKGEGIHMPAIPCGSYRYRYPDGSTEEIKVWRSRGSNKRHPDCYLVSVRVGEGDRDNETLAKIKRDGTLSFLRAKPDQLYKETVEIFFMMALKLDPPKKMEVRVDGDFGFHYLHLVRPACARCGRTLEGSEIGSWISDSCAKKWGV